MDNTEVCMVVAHDAGGAEILASYIMQNELVCRFVLAGPALTVFQRKLGDFELSNLQQGLEESTWCLCGTSWQSDLEWQAIQQAKHRGINVVAFIEHWVNYPERFIREGVQHLPDMLWVGDAYAEQIAKQHFSNIPIKVVDNPYLKDIKQEIDDLGQALWKPPKVGEKLLFVSENLSGHALLKYGDANYFGYTEFDALGLLLNNLECVSSNVATLIIRPHPSDLLGKYDGFLERYPGLVEVSAGVSLAADIAAADVVAGCESMALVVGVLANKKVYSCISIDKPCRLPHKEIVMLNSVIVKKT
jgi:hypothetical protein